MTGITTKIELITALKSAHQRAENWFLEIPASGFFTRQGEVWSAVEKWDKSEFDQYLLPHPIIGKLTNSRDAFLYDLSQSSPCQPNWRLITRFLVH